jgi:phosphoglycerate dehydrogenase-like enzyme
VLVLSQFDSAVTVEIQRRLPQVDVLEVPVCGPLPADIRGDALLVHFASDPETLVTLAAGGVRWVHFYSSGVNRYPLNRIGPGVVMTCSRGASSIPIAEFVLGSMLAFEKRFPEVWDPRTPGPMRLGAKPLINVGGGELFGKTVGIIGLGGIGRRVARLCHAFGMEVVGCRRSLDGNGLDPSIVVLSPEEVLPLADHLVLCAPLTVETRHFINDGSLRTLKRGVHIVNVARGELIDTEALIRGLDDGMVAGASLDVVEPTPLPSDHPLWARPNVRISPHISAATVMAVPRHMEFFYGNLSNFLAGRTLKGIVRPEKGY